MLLQIQIYYNDKIPLGTSLFNIELDKSYELFGRYYDSVVWNDNMSTSVTYILTRFSFHEKYEEFECITWKLQKSANYTR